MSTCNPRTSSQCTVVMSRKPSELTSQSRDVDKHGGGDNDLLTGSEVTRKKYGGRPCPRQSRDVNKDGG